MTAPKIKKIKTSFFSIKVGNSLISPRFNIGQSVFYSGKIYVISKVIYDIELNSFMYCFQNHGLKLISQSLIDDTVSLAD